MYAFAYLNAALCMGYFLLWLSGLADYPKGWDGGDLLMAVAFIVAPLLPIFGLNMRYQFDLLRMSDGTSMPSRFIWSALSMSLTLLMLYAFMVEIVL